MRFSITTKRCTDQGHGGSTQFPATDLWDSTEIGQANRVEVAGLRLPPLPHHPACGFDRASLDSRPQPLDLCWYLVTHSYGFWFSYRGLEPH